MTVNEKILDAETFLLAITTITAILAFIQSSLALYKTNAPISITLPEKPFFDKGMIGYYNDDLEFIPVFASETKGDLELCILTLRVINPKSYPITLFNIYVSDEHKTIIPYFSRIQASFLNNDLKLFAECHQGTMGITLPYSHYITIPPGTFSHVDIVLCANDFDKFKKLHLSFRDSSKTFLKRKNRKIINGAKLNHPLHSYNFHLDAKP